MNIAPFAPIAIRLAFVPLLPIRALLRALALQPIPYGLHHRLDRPADGVPGGLPRIGAGWNCPDDKTKKPQPKGY